MPNTATRNIDTIIDGQLYIGKYVSTIRRRLFFFWRVISQRSHCHAFSLPYSFAAAKSVDLRRQFGITHIVSACPDLPLQGPDHLVIPVQDSEYADILIHFPDACRFIQNAVNDGGRVLVHCRMGISRSATVIAAYCKLVPHWERPNTDRNSPQTSDVDSPHLRP